MSANVFTSGLATPMAQFVALKQKQGLDYQDQASRLRRFDRFLASSYASPVTALNQAIFKDYIASMKLLKRQTQRVTLSVVRHFSIFHNLVDLQSAVLSARLLPKVASQPRVYVFSSEQVQTLMQSCEVLADPIRQDCMRVLMGLLYSNGLRLGEALALRHCDVDLTRRQLHIPRGKNRRERLLVLAPCAGNALAGFLQRRQRYGATSRDRLLFMRGYDTPLLRGHAYHTFQRLLAQSDISGTPHPRLHDLRHSFAMNLVVHWRATGADINALLPVLSTAMGHANIASTEYYLHATADFTGAFGALETYLHPRHES